MMERMDERELLEKVAAGELSAEEALAHLRTQPLEDLGFAVVDHHRRIRQGVCEVIYCAGKTPGQTARIVRAMVERGEINILCTRADKFTYEAVREAEPDCEYHEMARIVVVKRRPADTGVGTVLVATGGTSDMMVAEEAAITAEVLGSRVDRMYDVGVAGLHRLLAKLDRIAAANVVVAVAGMEGALPSVIGGLTDRPVIAVPTSVGYGAAQGGMAALHAMLNSCASGISVVTIDNGFGAGYTAALINRPGRA
jgi:NCAIR mutase (PurE)-related protein